MPKANELEAISSKDVTVFRIKNRQGYAALCRDHLTEGKTADEAYSRMVKAVKRSGYLLKETK